MAATPKPVRKAIKASHAKKMEDFKKFGKKSIPKGIAKRETKRIAKLEHHPEVSHKKSRVTSKQMKKFY